MKKASDPRHIKRRQVIKELFAQDFTKQNQISPVTKDVLKSAKKIDKIIAEAAPEWPVDKINRIDRAILRYSVWELLQRVTPPKVVIDESVELAKEFGSESSSAFVNGVMGNIYEKI